jgi:NAD-dependent dihydropyrimidine dehydrogenase PreA subunit
VRVCPYGVFEVRVLGAEERAGLGTLARLKLWVHGGRQAQLKAPADCHACGLCVKACPERAITLRAV